jgi:Fur family transcriptional regulator, iron response regulator
MDASKTYFDTNNSAHHHFFVEDKNELMDIPPTDVLLGTMLIPPEGYEIIRIDVVVRLRRKREFGSEGSKTASLMGARAFR